MASPERTTRADRASTQGTTADGGGAARQRPPRTPQSALLELHPAIGNHAAVALLARVMFGSKDVKPDPNGTNEQILRTALDWILKVQDQTLTDPMSWLSQLEAINAQLQATGLTPSLEVELGKLYQAIHGLNFSVNPILGEAWKRCLDATRTNKSLYNAVGGKFLPKFTQLLDEIAKDFPNLAVDCSNVVKKGVNKEHMINKGGGYGGAQTDPLNLMHAGIPAVGSPSTISPLHKALHAAKPGTGSVDYTKLHPQVEAIIVTAQAGYDPNAFGVFV
ncbi:MAG TPA: hypothetical protein VHF89_09020 [Solirubrobacteraceae bacterium]|nr:hypothetical protein [Solirubrobacteraceae bacterium]